jgi:hypothetical protein
VEKPADPSHAIDNWVRRRIFRSAEWIPKFVTGACALRSLKSQSQGIFLGPIVVNITPVGDEGYPLRRRGPNWSGLKVRLEGELIFPRGVVRIGL